MTSTATPFPSDSFAGASTLFIPKSGNTVTTNGSNSSAGTEDGERDRVCGDDRVPIGKTVWYKLLPEASGAITADTNSNTDFDTVLVAYSRSDNDNSLPVNEMSGALGCSDDTDDTTSKVLFLVSVSAGQTYYLQLGGYGSGGDAASGNFQLSVSLDTNRTSLPEPTATFTPVPVSTETPIPTNTATPVPSETPIPTSTPTPASAAVATSTSTSSTAASASGQTVTSGNRSSAQATVLAQVASTTGATGNAAGNRGGVGVSSSAEVTSLGTGGFAGYVRPVATFVPPDASGSLLGPDGRPLAGAAPGTSTSVFADPLGTVSLRVSLAALQGTLFLPASITPAYVENFDPNVHIYSGPFPEAVDYGVAGPQFTIFTVVAPQVASRLYVYNPATDNYGWIDVLGIGPVPAPA